MINFIIYRKPDKDYIMIPRFNPELIATVTFPLELSVYRLYDGKIVTVTKNKRITIASDMVTLDNIPTTTLDLFNSNQETLEAYGFNYLDSIHCCDIYTMGGTGISVGEYDTLMISSKGDQVRYNHHKRTAYVNGSEMTAEEILNWSMREYNLLPIVSEAA